MLPNITAALVASVLLGLAANQITRLLLQGSIFKGLRSRMEYGDHPLPHKPFWRALFACHLCLGQEVSLWMTWAVLAVGLTVNSRALPLQVWPVLFVVGPFAVGAVDQFVEMVRGFSPAGEQALQHGKDDARPLEDRLNERLDAVAEAIQAHKRPLTPGEYDLVMKGKYPLDKAEVGR